jgi:thiaminase/transcriptional activator TenA
VGPLIGMTSADISTEPESKKVDIFARLKEAAAAEWDSYVNHDFVRQLGAGTLPETAFRTYLIQDYLFLVHFARAWALAAYKGRTIGDIRAAQEGLAGILDETDLHVRLCAGWGIARDELERASEHQATIAYTRFVLDCGAAGDLLDLQVALAPCVIGYAEIGATLATNSAEVLKNHPYGEWISEYAGEPYQLVAVDARKQLDALAARSMTGKRFEELARLFATASRLEADFWQMGLDASPGTPNPSHGAERGADAAIARSSSPLFASSGPVDAAAKIPKCIQPV